MSKPLRVLGHCPVPFTLTPGVRALLFCHTPIGIIRMPVVCVGGALKLPDGHVVRLQKPYLETPSPLAWAKALWRYPGIKAALGGEA